MGGEEGRLSDLQRWLQPRLAGVPDALRDRILHAANDLSREARYAQREHDVQTFPVSRATLHDRLREAGRHLLAQAIAMPPSRDAAVTLLAADALMTFACEAMAEAAPERLGDMR